MAEETVIDRPDTYTDADAQRNVIRATQQPLMPAQVAEITGSIATALMAIERLAIMADVCTDLQDRGAMATGIECIAKYAGGLADMVNVAHGGVGIRGDFNDWSRPGFLESRNAARGAAVQPMED